MAFHLFHFTLFCCILACSLECYACKSQKSFDDCQLGQRSLNCLTHSSCASLKLIYRDPKETTIYSKDCIPTSYCNVDNVVNCQNGNLECEINCCSDNLCNWANTPLVSGILFMAMRPVRSQEWPDVEVLNLKKIVVVLTWLWQL